jgi:seryl-tRNA synthetase
LENYQREDGIEVPEVLRKYIPGQPAFLPYVKELPKDSTSLKAKVCFDIPRLMIEPSADRFQGKGDGKAAPKLPKEGEIVERPKHKAEEVKS